MAPCASRSAEMRYRDDPIASRSARSASITAAMFRRNADSIERNNPHRQPARRAASGLSSGLHFRTLLGAGAVHPRVGLPSLPFTPRRYAFPHDSTSPVFLQRNRPAGLHRRQPGRRCPEPGCAARAAQSRHRQRRARPVRSCPGGRIEPAPAVWLGRIREPAAQHRHRQQCAGPGLPEALQRPGRGHQLPQRMAAGGGAAPGLADAAGQLDRHLQRRPALCTAQRAPGHRQSRCAVGQRGAGDLAQHRQVAARCLRPGVRCTGCQGRPERGAALGTYRRGGR
jgi:hypothetical protein